MTQTDVYASLTETLETAKERLAQAEAVADVIPQLKREIRALERTLSSLSTDSAAPRTGPTIAERVLGAVGSGVTFEAGAMLPTSRRSGRAGSGSRRPSADSSSCSVANCLKRRLMLHSSSPAVTV